MEAQNRYGDAPSPSSTAFHYTPVGLYNGMIYPLRHYTFKEWCGIRESQMWAVGANIRLCSVH